MGYPVQAARLIKASLALRKRVGHRNGEAGAINELGSAYRQMGRLAEAQQLHRRAIAAAADAGERDVESAALNDLGLTLSATSRQPEALEAHRRALELATRISHPYEQGRALAAMAGCLQPHDQAEARRHWERALTIFQKLGVPERFEAQRRIAMLT
ncbi:tetratricopeptide repeat protein [Plantactinospora sp. WMMB782]|uniref:tetratricopeptide repeat protein n=1 Tax=Plantactinospora sp. WMMB782 TaxID=3404121 RepID=UPI003B953E19